MKNGSKILILTLALVIASYPVAAFAGASAPEASSQSRDDTSVNPATLIKNSNLKCKKNKAKVAVWKYGKWVVVCL